MSVDQQPSEQEKKLKRALTKAQRESVITGLLMSFFLVGLIYSIFQNKILKKELIKTQTQVDSCRKELLRYKDVLQSESKISEQMAREAEEKLKKSSQKK